MWATELAVSQALADPVFRFSKAEYVYTLNGVELPHVTTMLSDCGYIDEQWFTEEGRERGSMVHDLAASYDLGAIEQPAAVECIYKGWFLAYVQAMRQLEHHWQFVETAMVSLRYRFGGRIDRGGVVWGAKSVVELKTGQRHPATPIQLALQAILVAPEWHLPPEAIIRYELDLKKTGKCVLYEHKAKADFDKAYEVIQVCCK